MDEIEENLKQLCEHCGRFGASIRCHSTGCQKCFHYPCAVISGCYQNLEKLTLYCQRHIEEAREIASCSTCSKPGDISSLLLCTLCQNHFHSTCLSKQAAAVSVKKLRWKCENCELCQICRKWNKRGAIGTCTRCCKNFHSKCLPSGESEDMASHSWLCKMCKLEVSGEQEIGRRSSIGNVSFSPGASPTVSSPSSYSKDENSASPIAVTKKEVSDKETSKCVICNQDCHVEEDVLPCRYCSGLVHMACDHVPVELHEFLKEKNYSCLPCRREHSMKKIARCQVTHLTKTISWSKGSSVVETKDILNSQGRTSDKINTGKEISRHPGNLYKAEDTLTTGLIITEPITWSRLKVVYSFEYDGTLR